MTKILRAYKKGGNWYNDDPDNGFSEADNELVAGVPEVIELFVGDATRAEMVVSTAPIQGGLEMTLVNDKVAGGVEYDVELGDHFGTQNIWLCEVFFTYYSVAPKKLYAKILKA